MKIREAEILQAAAVAVAAPRYMGAFAYAIGINLVQSWAWFSTVEVLSGLAMALLEGWAVAFISRRWSSIPRGTQQHRIIAAIQAALLLMLPLTALPYLVGMNVSKPTLGIMPMVAIWAWEFVVAAVSPLIAAAVGYVDATASPDTSAHSNLIDQPITQPITQPSDIAAQIIAMRKTGATHKDIASTLNISVATVGRRLKGVMPGN